MSPPRLRVSLALAALVAATASGAFFKDAASTATAGVGADPNFVVIMTDDQTKRTFNRRVMPKTFRELVDPGTYFPRAIAAPPLCCPARAGFQTGQYPHNHGVLKNAYRPLRDPENVLPTWLRNDGYRTGLVGKYMNGYPSVGGAATPPGFDSSWFFHHKPGYWNYDVSVDGTVKHMGTDRRDYSTTAITREALDFIGSSAGDTPFFLWVSYWAPHERLAIPRREICSRPGPQALAGDWHDWKHARLPTPASFNERSVGDKPPAVRRPLLSARQKAVIRERYRCTLAALQEVDRGVADISDRLERVGEGDETVIFYLSDNGFFFGEHRIPEDKQLPYRPAVEIPFAARAPSTVLGQPADPRVSKRVANIDLAPTMLELAGAQPCKAALECRAPDGRSLMPLLNGTNGGFNHRAILIELFPGCRGFDGYVTERTIYTEWRAKRRNRPGCGVGFHERYNLAEDPFQLRNRIDNPAGKRPPAEDPRHERLKALSRCSGTTGPGACE